MAPRFPELRRALTPMRVAIAVTLLALASSAYQVVGIPRTPAMLAVAQGVAAAVFQT